MVGERARMIWSVCRPLAGWLVVCESAHCRCNSHGRCAPIRIAPMWASFFIPFARRVSTLVGTSLCWDVWPKLIILPYK